MHPSAIYDSYLLLTMVMWLAIMQLFVCYIAFFAIDLHEHECHTQLLFARKKNPKKTHEILLCNEKSAPKCLIN